MWFAEGDSPRLDRLSARYRVTAPCRLVVDGGWLRRSSEVDATVVDLSVDGASVVVAEPGSPFEVGQGLGFSVEGCEGRVVVRHAEPTADGVLLGLRFLERSEALEQVVFSLIAAKRGEDGELEDYWAGAE